MRAAELVSEVKSRRMSRISWDGRMRCAHGLDTTSTAKSRHVCSRTSGKGFPGRFFSTKGRSCVSAMDHTAASGVAPAPTGSASSGARPCSTAAQQAMAPLQTSFCGDVASETTCRRSGDQLRKNTRPLEWAEAFAHALSPQSFSTGSRLSSIPAIVWARGASGPGSNTPINSGLRSSTRPSSRATQSRTELSHMGSTSSRASCAGKPCRLTRSWPAG
mmetsp:Transcript_90882/g.252852  ORF Transcript_90882/g.252852 Transcript_90882/m.252852 type:complete len:218 (-) Transcript_90882:658-1311(-)